MKNKSFSWQILCAIILLILIYGNPFADSLYVCVDPGHGGYDNGTHGRVYGSLEKDANLNVGLALKDSLLNDPEYWVVPVMTRVTNVYVEYEERINKAMHGGPSGTPVDQFLSIHHNAPDTTPPNPPRPDSSINYTVTFYCDRPYVEPGDTIPRDVSDDLAERVNAKVKELLQQAVPDIPWGTHDAEMTCFYILRRTSMISALCEVSFMTNHKIDSLYKYNATNYSRKEANGVYRGWHQYIDDDPIIVVRNHFGGGYVLVDSIYRESPFHGCWRESEWHTIGALNQWWGDNYYWCEWSDAGTQYHTIYVRPWDEVITAFFSYDHYWVHVVHPSDYGISYEVGKNMRIYWSADTGVYDTPNSQWGTYLDFYLSRDGGTNYETIATNYWTMGQTSGCYDWSVNGIASNQCLIKIAAHDGACNRKEDISDHNFSLQYKATVKAPLAGYEWQIGDYWYSGEDNILWEASPGHNNSTLVDIFLSRNGGINWETIATNSPNTGKYTWEVRGSTSSNCKIEIRAHDSAGNVTETVSDAFSITYKFRMMSPDHFMCVGWSWVFRWLVSIGENASTVVDAYLSRDGGSSYPEHLGTTPYSSSVEGNKLTWLVTSPHANDAMVKFMAHDSYGHSTEYITPVFTICGGCIRGDINHNSIYYEVADAVALARWFVDSTNICDPDPVYHISPCDTKCDTTVHLSDLVFLVRILLGDFIPCDEGPPYQPDPPLYAGGIEVKAKRNDSESIVSMTSEHPIGALAFDFNTNGIAGDPLLLTPNMQFKTSAQNGKLRVLIWSDNGENIPPGTHDIFMIPENAELVSVKAASYDYKDLKVNITNETTPSSYTLFQNHPNPFNPYTRISFNLPNAIVYTLKIYNVIGQLVKIYGEMGSSGPNTIIWDGRDNAGNEVSSGIYFYRLQAGVYNEMRKMVLIK